MDGSLAIEANREALKRIVAMLVEMAGLAEDAPFTSPFMGVRSGRPQAGRKPTIWLPERRTPGAMAEGRPVATKSREGVSERPTLPRILWRAILALLRPAESAARRLIIAASRGLTAPPPRLRQPKPATMEPLLRRFGIAVMVGRGGQSAVARRAKAEGGVAAEPAVPRVPALPLFDPPRRLSRQHNTIPPHAAPRIFVPGVTEPAPLPPPPTADDRVSATRLIRRIAALAAALDDLPRHARRFARWQARLSAENTRDPVAPRRLSPIRRGRPPGGRLTRYDPSAAHPRNTREIDEILAHAHSLALHALESPDTS